MKLFTRKTTKLKDRIASLEQHIGVVFTDEDGYPEHLNRPYGELVSIAKDIKELKEKAKD